MDDQILKLPVRGYGIRGIAKCLNIARNTVRLRLRKNVEKAPTKKGGWWDEGNWDAILKERHKGVTLKQIYAKYGTLIDLVFVHVDIFGHFIHYSRL